MAKRVPLDIETYNKKRDFTKTAEPKGRKLKGKGDSFVVQKHDASPAALGLPAGNGRRAEKLGGAQGAEPRSRHQPARDAHRGSSARLWRRSKGTIPKGEYGGGTVMLWDHGSWIPEPGKDPRKTIEEGHLHFTLEGERMKGEWVMFRMKAKPGEKGEAWMLKKVDRRIRRARRGRRAGRAMRDQRHHRPHMAEIAAAATSGAPIAAAGRAGGQEEAGRRAAEVPPPQLATLVDAVPSGADWLFEYKYDGYRLLIATGERRRDRLDPQRQGLERQVPRRWSRPPPALPAGCLIDGEAVALGKDGKPDFQLLQATLKGGRRRPRFLRLRPAGRPGRGHPKLPNIERKERLAALLKAVPAPILYGDHVIAKGEALFEAICKEGGEGIIAKKAERAVSRRTGEELAQGQVHPAPGIRHRRLAGERQKARLPLAPPRG